MSKPRKPANIQDMLNFGLNIMKDQLNYIAKNDTAKILDPKVSATLTDYIRTLISFKKEERASSVDDDLEKLSDAELTAMAKQASDQILAKDKK